MSIVCCKVEKDTIVIASDSIAVRGYTQSKGDNGSQSKLFKVNGMVIGGVGMAEETSLLRIFAQTRKPKGPSEDDLLVFMSEFAGWKNKKTGTYKLSNVYIICYSGTVFSAEGFYIEEITGYQAIGAGMDYALAAMYLGGTVEKAVETACELSVYCEKPIIKYEIPVCHE